jgi:glycosyltransferase involved in cell wall biosynthesis
MTPTISVIIPTHAPHPARLSRTLAGLQAQSLPRDRWELVIIDNRSPTPIALDLCWHPSARVVREERIGLTNARLAGGAATKGEVLVFVDDDNVLASDYLEVVANLFAERPQLGAAGGKSLPEWETVPEIWVQEFASTLALRDLGKEPQVAGSDVRGYPSCAPVGAGMALRRSAWAVYVDYVSRDSTALTDRTGGELTSGGDNDIVLRILKAGWEVGYFPQLSLTHLIPAGRLSRDYLARLNHGIAKSWVQVLHRHGICPWPPAPSWQVAIRKWRAYLRYRAWRGPAEYIRWKGVCGQFEGRALIRNR